MQINTCVDFHVIGMLERLLRWLMDLSGSEKRLSVLSLPETVCISKYVWPTYKNLKWWSYALQLSRVVHYKDRKILGQSHMQPICTVYHVSKYLAAQVSWTVCLALGLAMSLKGPIIIQFFWIHNISSSPSWSLSVWVMARLLWITTKQRWFKSYML